MCLGATSDYWINAMDGQPFFDVNQEYKTGVKVDGTTTFLVLRPAHVLQ